MKKEAIEKKKGTNENNETIVNKNKIKIEIKNVNKNIINSKININI